MVTGRGWGKLKNVEDGGVRKRSGRGKRKEEKGGVRRGGGWKEVAEIPS